MQSHISSEPRLAYLTGEYPAVSHTFILREIEALRQLGLEVETCSIRRTDPGVHHRGEEEKRAAAETFYVLQALRNPLTLIAAQLVALRRPHRWLGALGLALRTAPPGLRGLVYQLIYFAEASVLARHLSERGATRLHNHFADSSCTVSMLTSALSGIPFSFTMHGPNEFFAAERWRLDEKISRATQVACISHFCRSQLMIFAPQEVWRKLHIVHCGVEPERYSQAGPPKGGKHILFVGRLASVKGVPVLLEAFAEVVRKHPEARLTLVGDGPERLAIEAKARALEIADVVNFAGFRSQTEVAAVLAEADIFALPSFAEGVPVVLMEAMASVRPVVATRIAGIGELVEDNVTGMTVPPGSAADLAEALSRLMDDPALAARLAEAGRHRVVNEYNINIEAARLAALFCESTDALRPPAIESRCQPSGEKRSSTTG